MDIELLLKNFYAGDSTQEEERLLMVYFLSEKDIDERWEDDRQLFRILHDRQVKVPAGVSARLEETINRLEVKPLSGSHKSSTSPYPLQRGTETKPISLSRKRTLYYWISSAAAVVLLCIGLFFIFRDPPTPKMADTFSDPKEAAIVAQQTLAFMSMHLNRGLDKASEVEQEFERIDQILHKHLGK